MDEIKFYCPECRQKIAVLKSDAGRQMDCPICRATVVIPSSADATVEVVTARKPAKPAEPERKIKDLQSTARLGSTEEPKKPALASPPPPAPRVGGGEVERLKVELEQAARQLKEALAERSATDTRLAAAEEELARSKAQVAETNAKSEALEKERDELRAQSAQTPSQENELAELRAQLAARDAQLAAMTSLCESQRIEARKAGAEVIKFRAELDAAHIDTQNVRRQLREVGEHFANSERERIELLRQIQENALVTQVASAEAMADALREQLSEKSVALELLQIQRDRLLEQLQPRDTLLREKPPLGALHSG
ncbi:MAG: hypothetical protein V4710_03375, partial [Verrucomicrobiota bacterium]